MSSLTAVSSRGIDDSDQSSDNGDAGVQLRSESPCSSEAASSMDDSEEGYSSDATTEDQLTTLELTRINTHQLQQKTTVGSTRGPLPRERWLPMGANKEYPPLLHSEDYVVEFDGPDDPLHPYNWPMKTRLVCPGM